MKILHPLQAHGTRRTARKAARAGDWHSAAQAYRSLVRQRVATAQDMVQLAHALKESGDATGAAGAYHAAAAACPHDGDAQLHYGLSLEDLGRNEEAVHALARALSIDPGNSFVRTKLVSLGIAEDAHDGAILTGILAGYDALARRPGPVARLALGWQLRRARGHARACHWSAAARSYRRMLARYPYDPRLLIQLGHALREQGDATEAIAAYQQALISAPRQPETYLHLGHALKALDRREAALQAYLTAARLQPGLPAAMAEISDLGWSGSAIADVTGCEPVAAPRLAMPGGLTRHQQSIWRLLAARVDIRD